MGCYLCHDTHLYKLGCRTGPVKGGANGMGLLALLAAAPLATLVILLWTDDNGSASTITSRNYPGLEWDIVVDRMDKWSVSSERIRLVCRSPIVSPPFEQESVIACDWGAAFVHEVHWLDAKTVVVSGWKSASDDSLLESWRDVRITYEWSNR